MTVLYKNAGQAEFTALAREIQKALGEGTPDAAIARLLHVSAVSVSRILKGEQNPSPRTLELLRTKHREVCLKGELFTPEPAVPLKEQIAFLEKNAPAEAERRSKNTP